jgi:hypothetical protein
MTPGSRQSARETLPVFDQSHAERHEDEWNKEKAEVGGNLDGFCSGLHERQ